MSNPKTSDAWIQKGLSVAEAQRLWDLHLQSRPEMKDILARTAWAQKKDILEVQLILAKESHETHARRNH